MLVVGLTGGIASGKSTVSKILSSSPYNIPIIDADVLAREAINPGTSGFHTVVKHFGSTVVSESGEIDRAALGQIIFNSPSHRQILNGIIHPFVRREIFKGILRCWIRGEWIVILDIPLLIEASMWKMVAEIVVVYVSDDVQLQRLLSRPPIPPSPPLTEEAAKSRISSQLPLSSKLAYATHILDNSGSKDDLQVSIHTLYKTWQRQRKGWWLSWLIPPVGVFWAAWSVLLNLRRVRLALEKQKKPLSGSTLHPSL